MKIIAIGNPKGGSGKTISAVNIAYALIRKQKKVLLIDSDPRGAVETYLNVENKKTLFELIKEQYNNFNVENFKSYIINKNGLDIIISSHQLAKLDKIFDDDIESELSCIQDIIYLFEEYDFVVFDTEGTINNLTKAILKVTDFVFTPTQASDIDINGIRDLLSSVESAKRRNRKLEVKKIFLVRAKQQTNAYKNFREQLKKYFNEKQFSQVSIRENQDIINAMSEKLDIFTYKNSSNGAIDYRNLVDEFLEDLK